MPIVNYVREHTRFMEYATDEHLSASERLLWYALMHVMNQRAQGNIWPEEFIRISNDRLLSYCPMKFDTMANARNGLKQRGLIEFTKGDKNKLSPAYRMIYFYPQYVAPNVENYGESNPEKSDNMGGNMGGNMGYNTGGNMGYNTGDIYINNTDGETYSILNPVEIHTQQDNDCKYSAPRARTTGYFGLDGKERAARYDSAWKTSLKARGAVAQRVIDNFPFPYDSDPTLHQFIADSMLYGMPPELIEDVGRNAKSMMDFRLQLHELARNRGYTEDAHEWQRCLKIARGNTEFAKTLFKMRQNTQEEAI